MKTQIFTLNNIISDFIDHDIIPANSQIKELCQALTVFIDELVFKVFNIEFSELDFHLLLEHPQVSQAFKSAREAYDAEQYGVVLKDTSLAFHIALEEQRQKLNYLSENGLLKPELLMLDKSIELHINPKDQDFIHLVLGTQPTKLEKFKQLVPTILVSEDDKKRPEIIVSDFVDDDAISKENAEFCLNFVLETILKWEGLDLVKTSDIKNVHK